MAALLGLFWRLLREGRLKVARGRSWRPEIGMEHASRGRRSGNKGVGARWRGRFRIFSARHCSRTKVSHAENSGMTMLFFSLEVTPVSEGVLTTGVVIRRRATTEWMARGGWFLFFSWRLLRCRRGVGAGARGGFNPLRGATTGVVMRRRATSGEMARGGLVFVFSWRLLRCRRGILSHPQFAAALSRNDRAGGTARAKLQGNSFTLSPAVKRPPPPTKKRLLLNRRRRQQALAPHRLFAALARLPAEKRIQRRAIPAHIAL